MGAQARERRQSGARRYRSPAVGAHSFLAALQLADSAFPVGGHAHSHGLEQFVREGLVADLAGVAATLDEVAAGRAPGNHAVAFGAAARAAGLGLEEAVLAFIHSFAVGWLSAAQRLLPLDPDEVQAALHRLRPASVAAASLALGGLPAGMAASTPLAEVMAMRHERAEVRLFAT